MNDRQPNHLLGESSPYLLLHLYNPVDWYSYTPDAFIKAQQSKVSIIIDAHIDQSSMIWE